MMQPGASGNDQQSIISLGLRMGALHGLAVWLIYAASEYLFISLRSLTRSADYTLSPWHWKWSSILIASYAALGLLVGMVSGLAVAVLSSTKLQASMNLPWRIQAMCSLTLPVAFASTLVAQGGLTVSAYLAVLVCLAVTATLLLRAAFGRRLEYLDLLLSPWTVSFLSLMLTRSDSLMRSIAVLVFVLLVTLAAGWIKPVRWCSSASMPALRYWVFAAAAVALVLSAGTMLNHNLNPALPAGTHGQQKADMPNVVLLVMDTVRADHLSVYGYERRTTPNLEGFAQGAVRYANAIAASDITLSTHASIFTGLYPSWHGAYVVHGRNPAPRSLSPKFETLTEILGQNGYLTMAVIANYALLGREYKMDQGFQLYDARRPVQILSGGWVASEPLRDGLRPAMRRLLDLFISTSEMDMRYRRAAEVNQDVFALLDQVSQQKTPFFLFVNYMDAHLPYLPPRPFSSMFDSHTDISYTDILELREEVCKRQRSVTVAERNAMISQYDGGIAYLDAQIGAVIQHLKRRDLYENTMIIVVGDHGEAFGERDLLTHGMSVYQDQIHVPLLIKHPNQREGSVIPNPVSQVDLMPTVLETVGVKTPAGLHGLSLTGLKPSVVRRVLSESFANTFLLGWHQRFRRIERAVIEGPLKFVGSTAGKRQLYELSKDPNERTNMAPLHQELTEKLRGSLAAVVATAPKSFDFDTAKPMDQESVDRLRSLGYLQ
jgi:arylsulfatase A-like enzyme